MEAESGGFVALPVGGTAQAKIEGRRDAVRGRRARPVSGIDGKMNSVTGMMFVDEDKHSAFTGGNELQVGGGHCLERLAASTGLGFSRF